jgi:type IV pilus assembly protein PilO
VDKMRQWTVFTVLAVIAVLVAGWMLMIKPQRSHAADLRDQATQVQSGNDQLRNQISSLKAQAKDLPKQQARLAVIEQKIPDNPALPSLIRSLSDAADGAGVDLVSLAPSQPTALASTGTPATTVTAGKPAAPAAPALEQVPVTLSVTGTYFNIEQFVSNLEGLQRAIIVDGWSMAPGAKGGAAAAPGAPAAPAATDQLTAQIQARVFMAPGSATAAPTTTVHPAPTTAPTTSKAGG